MAGERWIRVVARSLVPLSLSALSLAAAGCDKVPAAGPRPTAMTSPTTTSPAPAGSSAAAPAAGRPEAFALMDPTDRSDAYRTYLKMSQVDGAAVRLDWATLEPDADDGYVWTRVDEALAVAKEYGKRITLHILGSSFGSPPRWVYQAGAASYSYTTPAGQSKTDPVPWDPIFLKKYADFLKDLAVHLTAAGYLDRVAYFSVAVPVPEMSLVSCRGGQLTTSLRYSRAAYLDAWKSAISAAQDAFPGTRKLITAPVSVICAPDNDGPAFFHDVLSYALTRSPDQFAIFATDLNARGSFRLRGISADLSRAPVALQFVWSATNDPSGKMQGSLRDAICAGVKEYKAGYVEVYKDDLRNPDAAVQQAIGAIHEPGRC